MTDTTPVAGTTRYLCPLPDCGWYHDSPPLGLADVSGLRPAPGAVGIQGISGSIAEQALQRRMQSVEAAVRGHLESHLLEDWARALVASQADKTQAEASIVRVRALHERMEGYGDFDYCDVCSNHGDIRWPCATIRAIEEA